MSLTSSQQLLTEGELIGASAVAKRFRSRRRNGPVTSNCVFRWMRYGARLPDGRVVRLEHVRVVGRYLTTHAAVDRFILAQQDEPQADNAALPRSASARRRDSERMAKFLSDEGFG